MTHMTIKKTMLESISRFKSSKGDLLRAQGMTMAVWAACLCSLLFLLNVSLRPLALLCPLMLIFIALPMRQSTAEAMQLFLSGAPMATVAMLPLNGYWKKVVRSLRMTGLMLLWLLPFAALVGLMQTLALEGAKYHIHVNALAPTAATRMTEGLMPEAVLAALKPKAVVPAMLVLAHTSAPTRTILCAGAGSFEAAHITLTQGVYVGMGEAAPEQLVQQLHAVLDQSNALVPESGMAQGQLEVGKAMAARGAASA